SRRKYKIYRPKVRVGLPKKNPKVLKPAFTIPPKLLQSLVEDPKWDEKGSVTQNYNSFGVVNDPNSLTDSLRAPPSVSDDPNDSGSDLEEDDLKSALGKRRRDGKSALPQPLTSIQRLYISRLVENIHRADGSCISDQMELEKEVVEFYKKVTGEDSTDLEGIDTNAMRARAQLNNDQRELLITTVTEEKVITTLKGIGNDKSPGIDGFGAYFFKKAR
ncbi:hypothetical protein RYX36_009420, partial [Vicia faba]